MRSGRAAIAVALMVALHASEPVFASGTPAASARPDWEVELAPYVWLISSQGDVQVGPVKTSVSVDFADLFKRLNIAVMLETSVRWRRWLLLLDGRYTSLTDRQSGGSTQINIDQAILEFALGYRVWKRALGDPSSGRFMNVDLVTGGRYWHNDLKLKLDSGLLPALKLDATEDFVDPLLGGRVRFDLTRRLALAFDADIGGFGAGSEFTWNARGLLDWRFAKHWTLRAGYRALGVDFSNSTPVGKTAIDLRYFGPILGISYRFGPGLPELP
jgi:hypothetical protein